MLLQETCRPAAETDSSRVEKGDATTGAVSSSCSSDTVRRFIAAVSNTKLLAKPSYILVSDVAEPCAAEINTCL